MNMEAIQKVAVSYQGSVVAADQTQRHTSYCADAGTDSGSRPAAKGNSKRRK